MGSDSCYLNFFNLFIGATAFKQIASPQSWQLTSSTTLGLAAIGPHTTFNMFLPFITSIFLAVVSLASLSEGKTPRCGPGKFFNGSRCEECPPGTYQNERGSTKCKKCPAGTYNSYRGAQGLDICIDCKAGTFRDTPGAASKKDCKKCPPGQNSPEGSSQCISCPAGTRISNCEGDPNDDFPSTFRGSCLTCTVSASGSSCILFGPLKMQCVDCLAGSFSKPNLVQAFECKRCPKGTTSEKRSSKCTPGRACPAGNEVQYDGSCAKCNFFTFNDGKSDYCEFCRPGYIANSRVGAVKCNPCPAGTFNGEDDSRCRPCKEGENSFVTGASFCVTDKTPCPPNFFRTSTGACETCTKLQRLDKKNKNCVKCPKNHLSEGGLATKCNRCPQGGETSDSFLRCLCRPGWGYGDIEGVNGGGCRKCPPGTSSPGTSYCGECYSESYAPKAGMAGCLTCPSGTSQPLRGQTKCNQVAPCRKGLIKSAEEVCVEPATNCPPNHRRLVEDEFETPHCNPLTCPEGTRMIRPYDYSGSVECGVCEKTERYIPNIKKCKFCRPNEFTDGDLSQECKKCPNGMEPFDGECKCGGARHMVNGKCVRCPKGTFGYNQVGGCEPCVAGTFSSTRGVFESCTKCPAGKISGPGASSCKPCPKGTVSFGVGDSACVRVGSLSA